jgi:hypothetical protein
MIYPRNRRINYLCGVFGLGSVRLGGSRTFGLWSKYFAGISGSRGLGVSGGEDSCENNYEGRGESNRTIVAIIFRLLLRCFFSCNITRSFLAILA